MKPLTLRTIAFLVASAAAPAAVAAQEPMPAGVVASDGRIVARPAIGRLTRLRLAADDTTTVVTGTRPVGAASRIEGQLVSYDGEYAVLDLANGYRFTIPVRNLSEFDQRVGPGPCTRSTGAQALCAVALVGAGMAIGYVAGDRIGETVSDVAARGGSNPWATRGMLLGTVIGLAMVPTVGRDEWVRLPLATDER